jgi:hypothetical protein
VKCGARVALGVAGGYFLGRTKKMKLALMLAGMAAGRRAGGPGELLSQGSKLLGRSPELSRLTDEVRGRLVEAGKQAAVAVATRQVEAMTDRVAQRVTSLTDVATERVGAPARKGEPDAEDREPEAARATEQDRERDTGPESEPETDGDSRSATRAEPAAEPPGESERPRRRAPAAAGRSRPAAATGAARRATGTATRAASKATGRPNRTRRSDDG